MNAAPRGHGQPWPCRCGRATAATYQTPAAAMTRSHHQGVRHAACAVCQSSGSAVMCQTPLETVRARSRAGAEASGSAVNNSCAFWRCL